MKKTQTQIERLWSKVDKSAGPDKCWPWMGWRGHCGHGRFVFDGRPQPTHRVAYELANGKITPGNFVCHHCDYPPCCNPKHLFEGTAKDNTRDMMSKGRRSTHQIPPMPGSTNPNSKLNEEQVAKIREIHKNRTSSLSKLAVMFGVSRDCIIHIVTRRTWKSVP